MKKIDKLTKYLLSGKTITSLEAFKLFGETRLSARIFDLKNKYKIADTWEETVDRFGNPCKYKRYAIIGVRNLEKEALEILKGLE